MTSVHAQFNGEFKSSGVLEFGFLKCCQKCPDRIIAVYPYNPHVRTALTFPSMLSTLKSLLSPNELKAQGIDDVLTKVDGLLPLPETASLEARFLTSKLNAISGEESLGANAKTRRRIKRILQRLTENFPGANLEEPWVDEPNPSNQTAETAQNDASTTLKLLNVANSTHLVERALNGLIGPAEGAKDMPEWKALKEVLYKLLEDRYITNKNIRRRISRLIYVIADEKDHQMLSKIKEDAQAQATAKPSVAHTRPTPKVFIGAPALPKRVVAEPASIVAVPEMAPEPVVVQVVVKSFAVCLQELQAAKCMADVDTAITAVSAHSSSGDLGVKKQVMETLQSLADDATLVNNTKIKRKVQRLLKTLEDSVINSKYTNNENVGSTLQSASAVVEESTPSDAAIPNKPAGGSGSSIADIVQRLREVRTGEQLDAVLIAVDLRDITVTPSATAPTITDTAVENENNSSSGMDAQPQAECQPEQRRLLKRTIEEVLSQEEVSNSLNAKIRRRVSRITSVLADIYDGNNEPTAASASGQVHAPVSAVNGASFTEPQLQRKVPHILFVGNLSYDATAAEVEAHLRECADLTGDVKVRVRTDPLTGLGRGVAFVEVEGSRELHQCIAAAHHSNMGGRIINVEKSCGGRNKEQRGQKIATKRSEQQRRSQEAVDAVLKDFEGKGVLQNVHKWGDTLKDAVYSHSPAYVNQVRPSCHYFVFFLSIF